MQPRSDHDSYGGMKRFAVFALTASALAHAQSPSSQEKPTPFAINPPDESSPFFITGKEYGDEQKEFYSRGYPRVKRNQESLLVEAKNIFTKIVSSAHLGAGSENKPVASLDVQPTTPVLKDNRELSLTYSVKNNSKTMVRLDFQSTQRIEILTRKSSGAIIDRWSDDRAFQSQEGLVVINPNERLEYQEKIPTRDMKAGESYIVEASMKSTPNYQVEQKVLPR